MKTIEDVMALVGEYGTMAKCDMHDECDDLYSEIEAALRGLVERNPYRQAIEELEPVGLGASYRFLLLERAKQLATGD